MKPLTASEVYKRSAPAIVGIDCLSENRTKIGTATGFLITENGRIVTNLHVIQKCQSVAVRLSKGDIYDSALVVDTDARKDLALIRIKGSGLPVLPLGDSNDLEVGQPIYSVGNPSGLPNTLQQGLVSAFRQMDGYRLVQVSASINPGNSGGPILDEQARVVAISALKISGAENLGFAIPVNYAKGSLDMKTEIPFAAFAEANKRATPAAGSPGGTAGVRTASGPVPAASDSAPLPVSTDPLEKLLRSKIRIWTMDDAKAGLGAPASETPAKPAGEGKPAVTGIAVFNIPGPVWKQATLRFNAATGKLFNAGLAPAQTVRWERQQAFMKEKFGDEFTSFDSAGGRYYVGSRSQTNFLVNPDGSIAYMTVLAATGQGLAAGTGGTGAVAPPPPPPPKPLGIFTKSASATTRIPAKYGEFTLWIDGDKWKPKEQDAAGRQTFISTTGEGFGLLISESTPLSTNLVKEVAILNSRKAFPTTRVVNEEKRLVNGRELWAMQMEAVINGIPVTYYGYYYGGSSGSLQILTYTIQSTFERNRPMFTEFLNGIEIRDKELPAAAPTPTSSTPGVVGGIIGSLPVAAPPPPPPPMEKAKPMDGPRPITVGGSVMAGKLIRQPKPVYPPLARQARIQGTVRLSAVIGKDGLIENLQVVSGHPLLQAPALEAVRQWAYQPTLMNNEPVKVVTTIDVSFTLSNGPGEPPAAEPQKP